MCRYVDSNLHKLDQLFFINICYKYSSLLMLGDNKISHHVALLYYDAV